VIIELKKIAFAASKKVGKEITAEDVKAVLDSYYESQPIKKIPLELAEKILNGEL